MAPNELLSCAKRVALYLARTCPDRLLDELMTELQTVETLNCLIERTETPPFYRLTSMRKTSSHSDGKLLVCVCAFLINLKIIMIIKAQTPLSIGEIIKKFCKC